MVQKIKTFDIPHTFEAKFQCNRCGSITVIEMDWGENPEMKLALTPFACYKCGFKQFSIVK